MRRQLLDANIPVRAVACGKDGLFHPSMCGEPDDAINIFTIPQTKESKALSMGFKLLGELPNAKKNRVNNVARWICHHVSSVLCRGRKVEPYTKHSGRDYKSRPAINPYPDSLRNPPCLA
ncbi:MAG: hypothetical protein NTX45_14875 [Proteobacteria bacterium]|nr:hypothetical protein [Pseudomonadota bacterium]